MNQNIKLAIDIIGSQAEFARRIGKSQPFVHSMLHNIKPIPPGLCRVIEDAVDRKVTRYQLRPDIFGEALDVQKKSKVV